MHENFIKAFNKIKQSSQILLVIHDRPDGDAIASACAMMNFLTYLKKDFFAFCLDKPPAQFSFLPFWEKISSDKERLNFSKYDLIIALDCGSLSRTNLAKEVENKNNNQFIIEFDHHPQIDNYADISLKDTPCRAPNLVCAALTMFVLFRGK